MVDGEVPIMFLSGWAVCGFLITTLITAFMTGRIKPATWTDAQLTEITKDRDHYRNLCREYERDLRELPFIQADMVTQARLLASSEGRRSGPRIIPETDNER